MTRRKPVFLAWLWLKRKTRRGMSPSHLIPNFRHLIWIWNVKPLERIGHCCAVFTVSSPLPRVTFQLTFNIVSFWRSPPRAQRHGSPGVDFPVTTPEVSSVPDQIRGGNDQAELSLSVCSLFMETRYKRGALSLWLLACFRNLPFHSFCSPPS